MTPIRCRQTGCGYELAQDDGVGLYISPKWRRTAAGDCLELPPNEVKRIRASVKRAGGIQSVSAGAVARMRPPAHSPEAEAKAFRRNEVHRPPLLLRNRIAQENGVLCMICPYCKTKNPIDLRKLATTQT